MAPTPTPTARNTAPTNSSAVDAGDTDSESEEVVLELVPSLWHGGATAALTRHVDAFCRSHAVRRTGCEQILAEARKAVAGGRERGGVNGAPLQLRLSLERARAVTVEVDGMRHQLRFVRGESPTALASALCERQRLAPVDCENLRAYLVAQHEQMFGGSTVGLELNSKP